MNCRPMLEQDIPKVLEIEVRAHSHPWSKGIFSDCLKVGYDCLVFESDDEMMAFSVMSYAPGEAHLLNICVKPELQGRGIGARVLQQLIARAREKKADTLFLEVRISNRKARHLYEKAGFNEIGRRFDYYPATDGREDALVFAKTL